MMKIYISGPITGFPNYKKRFEDIEQMISQNEHFSGWEIVNPVKAVPYNETWTWRDYMKEDIKLLIDCDAVFMMSNWELSKGACLEHEIARGLGLRIYYEETY